jgi:hypothetical protein
MIPRAVKAAYFAATWPIMRANGAVYRAAFAPKGPFRAHLGPGQSKYLSGWVNVDANVISAKCDVWSDLRNPLPFRSGSVKAFYSHHVIEHLPDLEKHFRDAFRCLCSGGVYRVGGPNGDGAISKFKEGDAAWFGDFPDKRRSLGGRFENFVFCRREHLTILTFCFLEEILTNVGFRDITRVLPVRGTGYPELFRDAMETESEDDFDTPHTLVVECRKP